GGGLAFYVGRASDIFEIESINPNLSFDVAQIFQTRDTGFKRTLAHMNAIAVSKTSQNTPAAFSVAVSMTDATMAPFISDEISLPPARKDLLNIAPEEPYLDTFFRSAIYARSWLDPNTTQTSAI